MSYNWFLGILHNRHNRDMVNNMIEMIHNCINSSKSNEVWNLRHRNYTRPLPFAVIWSKRTEEKKSGQRRTHKTYENHSIGKIVQFTSFLIELVKQSNCILQTLFLNWMLHCYRPFTHWNVEHWNFRQRHIQLIALEFQCVYNVQLSMGIHKLMDFTTCNSLLNLFFQVSVIFFHMTNFTDTNRWKKYDIVQWKWFDNHTNTTFIKIS